MSVSGNWLHKKQYISRKTKWKWTMKQSGRLSVIADTYIYFKMSIMISFLFTSYWLTQYFLKNHVLSKMLFFHLDKFYHLSCFFFLTSQTWISLLHSLCMYVCRNVYCSSFNYFPLTDSVWMKKLGQCYFNNLKLRSLHSRNFVSIVSYTQLG